MARSHSKAFRAGAIDVQRRRAAPVLRRRAVQCAAGLFDPLGVTLLLVSTMPAAFGGSSGLLWADSLMPRGPATAPPRSSDGMSHGGRRRSHRRRVHRGARTGLTSSPSLAAFPALRQSMHACARHGRHARQRHGDRRDRRWPSGLRTGVPHATPKAIRSRPTP